MAAARSLCRCFKTRVLHFTVKNTQLKDKKWKEKVQKNAQISFCGERDHQVYYSHVDPAALDACVSHDVGVANQWYHENGMLVNESKHQCLILGDTECLRSHAIQHFHKRSFLPRQEGQVERLCG